VGAAEAAARQSEELLVKEASEEYRFIVGVPAVARKPSEEVRFTFASTSNTTSHTLPASQFGVVLLELAPRPGGVTGMGAPAELRLELNAAFCGEIEPVTKIDLMIPPIVDVPPFACLQFCGRSRLLLTLHSIFNGSS
jgi:hypothetical protein